MAQKQPLIPTFKTHELTPFFLLLEDGSKMFSEERTATLGWGS